jgi:hypothetical protein
MVDACVTHCGKRMCPTLWRKQWHTVVNACVTHCDWRTWHTLWNLRPNTVGVQGGGSENTWSSENGNIRRSECTIIIHTCPFGGRKSVRSHKRTSWRLSRRHPPCTNIRMWLATCETCTDVPINLKQPHVHSVQRQRLPANTSIFEEDVRRRIKCISSVHVPAARHNR